MLAFYRDTLGIPLLFPAEPGEGWFAIQSGDVTVYFFEASANGKEAPLMADEDRGISCFSFAVEDLDQAIALLDSQVAWADEIRTWRHPSGTWYRYRFFADPEGNRLSITEPHKVA